MKLLLLYGPPAVGKLTIAKEIARLTGLKVFHAHLTVDLVASIFPRDTLAYLQLVWDIRFAVFAQAARAHLDGLIFTTVYGRDREPFIARSVEVVESYGGEVYFVHLSCHPETLRQRVVREDRKQYGKITSVELLNETLRKREPQLLFEAATRWESLSLNTDALRPVEAAQQVIAHYRLPTQHHTLTKASSCLPPASAALSLPAAADARCWASSSRRGTEKNRRALRVLCRGLAVLTNS